MNTTQLERHISTDLVLANKRLQNQIEQLQLALDSVPALIGFVDAQERYQYGNKLYEDWFGFSRGHIYGKTIKEVRGIEIYKSIRPYIKQVLSEKRVTYDNKLYKSDGSYIYYNSTYIPHKNIEGEVEGFFILLVDITERKHAEFRLKETEEKFTRLVDSNVIGVTVAGLDGKIYEANDVYLKMVGYTRQEFNEGKVNWRNMTPQEFIPIQQKAEKEVLENGSATPYEKEYIRKDGTRIPVLIGNVLLDKPTKKIIAFILDMSKQKELQQRKDEFIALASHELKTPLTSLQLFSQMMGLHIKKTQDSKSNQLFRSMEKQLNKINKLVNSLLDVSRIDAGKLSYSMHLFSFARLVNETIHELQTIHDNHTFLLQSNVDETVKADRERIKQVLSNLLTNAVKYSPKANNVLITVTKENNYLKVAIQDFGIGVPKALQDTIFNRYYQINESNKKSTSGMGLGLYLAKDIIERHNGKIWTESEYGKGATFYFTLPIAQQDK